MRGDIFKPGEHVQVLSKEEIIAGYGGELGLDGSAGDFVSDMYELCGNIYTIKSHNTYQDEDDVKKFGKREYAIQEPVGWVFPDFSLKRVQLRSSAEVLSDWMSLMGGVV